MKTILDACNPRKDILQGTFNPEIFTASINEVLRFYEGKHTGLHSIYKVKKLDLNLRTVLSRTKREAKQLLKK